MSRHTDDISKDTPAPSSPTALSHWFPLIQAAGMPVPRTVIVDLPKEAFTSLCAGFDGLVAGDMKPFVAEIAKAASAFGYPCFLRTDYTSAKHSWKDSCFLADEDAIERQVFEIVEYSEMSSLMGMPWDRWAVREMLPIMPVGVCPRFGDMPINREFRFFIDDGIMRCWHPYWPQGALQQGGAVFNDTYDPKTFETPVELQELVELAQRTGEAVGGSWSIDILETSRGWYVTDMAEADKSFHFAGCEHA